MFQLHLASKHIPIIFLSLTSLLFCSNGKGIDSQNGTIMDRNTTQRNKPLSPSTLTYKQLHKTIIGGRPARIGEAPYQLSLRRNGNHICGAVLIRSPIGRHLALTAAHCVVHMKTREVYDPDEFTVVAGSIIFNDTDTPVQTVGIRRIQVHQQFDQLTLRNDIALLILNGFFWPNSVVQPIRLPSDTQTYVGEFIQVSGWGNVQQFPQVVPKFLQISTLPVVDQQTCDEIYSSTYIYSSNLCVGYSDGVGATCNGDSGGPAVGDSSGTDTFSDTTKLVLLGLVSWGSENCTELNMPSVLTRLSFFKGWIRKEAIINDVFNLWIHQSKY